MRGADGAGPDVSRRRPRGVGVQQRRLRRAHVPAQPPVGPDRHAQHARPRLQRSHHGHLRRAARRRPPARAAAPAVHARATTVSRRRVPARSLGDLYHHQFYFRHLAHIHIKQIIHIPNAHETHEPHK